MGVLEEELRDLLAREDAAKDQEAFIIVGCRERRNRERRREERMRKRKRKNEREREKIQVILMVVSSVTSSIRPKAVHRLS